jgi:hypothetical protein
MRKQIYHSPCRGKCSTRNIVINKIYFQVRRTETIYNNLNPSWKVLYIPTAKLCDGNLQTPLRIEVFDEDRNSRDDLIGVIELTLSDLQNLSNSGSPVILKKGLKNRGQLIVRECQFEEPTSEHERKASITAYPPSRRESVYPTLGDLAHSRSDMERQAEAHELLGQGQDNYPAYQPYNPAYQPGYAGPGLTTQQPFDGHFSKAGLAQNSPSGPYTQTPCSVGYPPFSGNFPPTIPEDPTDTRSPYNWT